MEGISRRTALAAPSLLLTSGMAESAAMRPSAEAALRDFLKAFENCDLPRMERAFAADSTHFDRAPAGTAPNFAEYRRGSGMPPGMRKLAMQLPKTQPGPPYHEVTPKDLVVQTMGDIAICTFHLESQKSLARRTVVLRWETDDWKIAHLHASNIARS